MEDSRVEKEEHLFEMVKEVELADDLLLQSRVTEEDHQRVRSQIAAFRDSELVSEIARYEDMLVFRDSQGDE